MPEAMPIQEKHPLEMTPLPFHVLAVEDDKWNAYLLQEFLHSHVASITICSNAEEGLAYVMQQDVKLDVIITDINLPGISGIDFMKKVREGLSIPIVALSASMSKQHRHKLISQGFADALGKPFTQDDVLYCLKRFHKDAEAVPHSAEKAVSQTQHASQSNMMELLIPHIEEKVNRYEHALNIHDAEAVARLAHQLKSNLEQAEIFDVSETLNTIEVLYEMGKKENSLKWANKILPRLKEVLQSLRETN